MACRPARLALCVACSSLGAVGSASAAIITFTDSFVYQNALGSWTTATETFDALSGAGGPSLSGTVSDGFTPISWLASASGGTSVSPFSGSPALTTGSASALTIALSGGDVLAISGNFFGRNGSIGATGLTLQFTLADGTSSVSLIDATTGFLGFISDGAAFTAVTITPQSGGGALAPVVDNLGFSMVPSPGAIALLGLAGLASRRRR